MFPDIIRLGPLGLSFYGLAVAGGVMAALAILPLTAPRRGLSVSKTFDFCFWMVLAGLAGARLAYVAFHWPEFAHDWRGILAYWRGGLMFQGGLAGAVMVSPFFIKKEGLPFWPTADALAPSLALGQALGRLGCLAAGCCYGRQADWGLSFPLASQAPPGLLWPTQPVEAFFLALLALGLVLALRADGWLRRPGRVAALYLAGAGALRLTMEFFRGDWRGEPLLFNLPPTTLAAALTLALGLGLLLRPPGRAGGRNF